jgi:hypothetical protein
MEDIDKDLIVSEMKRKWCERWGHADRTDFRHP